MQNFSTGAGSFTGDGNLIGAYGTGRVSYVDTRGTAACAAELQTAPGRPAGRYVVTGSEALNHTEIAEKLSTLSGRPIRYVELSPEAFAAKLTEQVLSTAFARDVATFYEVAAGALEEMTGRYDEFVYVLSIKDGSLIRKIPVGNEPHGLCVWPQP